MTSINYEAALHSYTAFGTAWLHGSLSLSVHPSSHRVLQRGICCNSFSNFTPVKLSSTGGSCAMICVTSPVSLLARRRGRCRN